MFDSVLSGLLTSLIFYLLGVATLKISKFYLQKNPVRRLWRISDPKKLIICAATSTKTDTGQYYRPATGIGQLRALGQIVESLGKTYDIRVQNILLSINQIQRQIESDLILLGGPKNNEITKLFLEKIKYLNIVTQEGCSIGWTTGGETVWYTGKIADKKVIKDFGIAIRMRNPFDSAGRSFISLFSGSHTYGTIAAALYFTEHCIKKARGLKRIKDNMFVLVECDVIDGYPVGIKRRETHEF